MRIYFFKNLFNPINFAFFLISLISLISFRGNSIYAEYLSGDLQIDNSTKSESDGSIIPNNPFEIVEMIRRYNSLSDATNPTDALDDALKSFNSLEEK